MTPAHGRFCVPGLLDVFHTSALVSQSYSWRDAGDIVVATWEERYDYSAVAEADGERDVPASEQLFLGVAKLPNGEIHTLAGTMRHIVETLPGVGLVDIKTINLHLMLRMLKRNAALANPPIELPERLLVPVSDPAYPEWRAWVGDYRQASMSREKLRHRVTTTRKMRLSALGI